jgi:hypothetical protein
VGTLNHRLDEFVNAAQNDFAQMNGHFDAIDTQIQTLTANTNATLTELDTRTAELDEKLKNIPVPELIERAGQMEEKCTALTTQLAEMATRVAAVEAKCENAAVA